MSIAAENKTAVFFIVSSFFCNASDSTKHVLFDYSSLSPSFCEHRRKPERNRREQKEQDADNNERQQERADSFVNDAYGDLCYVLNDEDADSHRWNHDTDHNRYCHYHTEPDGVKTELEDCRVEDRRGKHHEGEVVDKGAPDLVHEADEKHDEVAVEGQSHDPVCRELRDVRPRDEMAEYSRPRNQQEKHAGCAQALIERRDVFLKGQISLCNRKCNEREGTDPAGFGRREEPHHDAPDNDHENANDPDYLGERCPSFFPGCFRTPRCKIRPDLCPYIDDQNKEESDDEAGDYAGKEKLPDRLFGDYAEHDEENRRWDDRAEGPDGRDDAGR